MASSIALARVKAADNAYKVELSRANWIKSLPRGDNVNISKLLSALAKVEAKDIELTLARGDCFNELEFPDLNTQEMLKCWMNPQVWYDKQEELSNWIEEIEVILIRLNKSRKDVQCKWVKSVDDPYFVQPEEFFYL